jgi:D-alanyl-D-alanine carboxypeptidase
LGSATIPQPDQSSFNWVQQNWEISMFKKSCRSYLVVATVLLTGSLLLDCGGGNMSSPSSGSCPVLPILMSSRGGIASAVDALVASEMKAQGLVGMTVAIAKGGTVLYTQAYGYADLSTCQAMESTAEFQIGSITKQFTAAAVLQLQNAGKLSIDNPVITYLPSYAFDPRITLRMLLNQTSGLADYLNFSAVNSWLNGVPEPTVLTQVAQAPLMFTPGSAFSYSNSNYFVLGSIIEAASPLSYANYLAADIFQPVGLTKTSYLQPSAFASPYLAGQVPGRIPAPSLFFAAGALWSNVQDLATWDAALLNGKVIPSMLFTTMVTPAPVPNFPQGGPSDYAMGWVRDADLGHPFVWHNGETSSYTSFNGMFLDDGFSVIILTNGPVNEDTPLLNLGEQIINAICSSSAAAGNC